MPLAVGTRAPDFTLSTKTADGPKQIKLSDNFGKKHTLLLFFPMAFTGTCTEEMCSVGNGLREYEQMNCQVYGISGDNPFAQEAWAQKEKIGVTLLSDYEHKVAKDYGVVYDSFLPQIKINCTGSPAASSFSVMSYITFEPCPPKSTMAVGRSSCKAISRRSATGSELSST